MWRDSGVRVEREYAPSAPCTETACGWQRVITGRAWRNASAMRAVARRSCGAAASSSQQPSSAPHSVRCVWKRVMLAPIITKDMKLFPTRPLPAGIKNVRSRAQSLDQFNQVQNSGSARGRIVPVKPRSSQSTGNLPAAAAAAASSGNGGAAPTTSPATTNSVPSFSRSPPKTTIHRKTTLTAIQEGVEMGHSHLHRHHHPVRHTESQPESKRSTDVPRRNSKKSRKTDDENNVTRNGHCENMGSTGTVGSDPPTEKKEKKGVLKWLTSALRKSKDKDMSDSCSCNSS